MARGASDRDVRRTSWAPQHKTIRRRLERCIQADALDRFSGYYRGTPRCRSSSCRWGRSSAPTVCGCCSRSTPKPCSLNRAWA